MRLFLSYFLFFLISQVAFAQEKAKVTVIKDATIDSLIARRIALQKAASPRNNSPLILYGYRVQVFFGPDRKKAYAEQARIKEMYPDFSTYISYTQPNYRIKVGDFRTRAEAQKLLNDLRPFFSSLFIFNERINPPKSELNDVD